jgi:hypothetical protein
MVIAGVLISLCCFLSLCLRLTVSYLAMLCMGMLPSMDYCHLGERLLDLKWHHYFNLFTCTYDSKMKYMSITTPSHV